MHREEKRSANVIVADPSGVDCLVLDREWVPFSYPFLPFHCSYPWVAPGVFETGEGLLRSRLKENFGGGITLRAGDGNCILNNLLKLYSSVQLLLFML